MKGFLNRSVALALVCTLVATSLVMPSYAIDYQSKYNFWNWLYDNSWFVGKQIVSLADNVCQVSDDTMHHATVPSGGFSGIDRDGVRTYTCVCDYCAETFTATATELENTYNDWNSDRKIDVGYSVIDSNGHAVPLGQWTTWYHTFVTTGVAVDSPTQLHVTVTGTSGTGRGAWALCYLFSVPYDCTVVFDGVFERVLDDGSYNDAYKSIVSSSAASPSSTDLTTSFVDNVRKVSVTGGKSYRYTSSSYTIEPKTTITRYFNVPRVYIELDDPSAKYQEIPVYGGGNLSFSVDNSETVYKTTQFINTDTNTFYNPATNTTSTLQSWQYDYDNRTYTGYTENGDVTIVYGDENITVVEGGNTYNYYYASPTAGGDGSGSNGDGSAGGDSGDDDGLLGKLGELLGTLLGGLIDLITGVLSNVMDNLIALVTMTIEKLGSIVNLFGSFGDALRSLWSWLPDDIITILSAGVSVVIFACVIKLFI